jgi:SAM-dependent methyltransferase
VDGVGDYLISHVKGIAREIPESAFPKVFRSEMAEAYREIESEHIEEDLESERVTALYVMTQYLRAGDLAGTSGSPEISEMIRAYWDRGPFERIRSGLKELAPQGRLSLVELGCGVGGLLPALSWELLSSYLGVDYSFASIVLARKFALGQYHGTRHAKEFNVPGDLFHGAVSRDVSGIVRSRQASLKLPKLQADFIVTDVTSSALKTSRWDACAALNIIDMLDRPEDLAKLQNRVLKKGGLAIESSPYVWHPEASKWLRKKYPKAQDSASAVGLLYEGQGFSIEKSEPHVPWLFFKHARQIELYSVHLMFARLASRQ